MNVLYDYQIFQMQNFGGISRYFFELMRNSKEAGFDADLSLLISSNEYLQNNMSPKTGIKVPLALHKKAYRISHFLNRYYSQYRIKNGNYDVFHPTFYETYFLNSIKKPFVLTVYDMINERLPKYFGNNDSFIEAKMELVKRATKVIAISQATKLDLMELYGTPESKIEVTYLAESISDLDAEPILGLPKRYILFVGKREAYKNFQLTYSALKSLLKGDPDLFMICAGGGAFTHSEIEIFKSEQLSDKLRYIHFNNDAQLKFLYQQSSCFIFPSLYEGFGIPVLEAFASGCPLCVSRTSSLVEIGSDSAIFFDPNSPDEIASAVNEALSLGKTNPLIEKGRHEAKRYSWQTTAKETHSIYSKI